LHTKYLQTKPIAQEIMTASKASAEKVQSILRRPLESLGLISDTAVKKAQTRPAKYASADVLASGGFLSEFLS
jgi:hypothetical protein